MRTGNDSFGVLRWISCPQHPARRVLPPAEVVRAGPVIRPSLVTSFFGEASMRCPRKYQAVVAAFVILAPSAWAQAPATRFPPRDVPAKSIPVPGTVSPELQAVIAQAPRAGWNTPPTTPEAWEQLVKQLEAAGSATVQPTAERLHVKFEASSIDGVKVYTVTPDDIPPENRNRLLVHVHGGCYVLGPHLAALPEALQVAGASHIKMISVNYRMPPEAYFPAALDDAVTVYKAATAMVPPKNLGVFGSSAGGALTLEMMLRAKAAGLPMPGAIAPGTPMADATNAGDTFQTNALVDNVLVSPTGFCDAATRFYAHGHDLADPLLSPIYGDFRGFPPAILSSGTRDLLLSNTVRTNQNLREAGVDTRLQVFEGQSHAQFYRDDRIPEDRFAIGEIAAWFDKHLGR
jgi:monoterpene epsilon-lactone hydrolase